MLSIFLVLITLPLEPVLNAFGTQIKHICELMLFRAGRVPILFVKFLKNIHLPILEGRVDTESGQEHVFAQFLYGACNNVQKCEVEMARQRRYVAIKCL